MARYSATMNVMIKAVERASKHLIRDFGEVEHLQVSMKGPSDFVTAADKMSEKILHEELEKARPDFGFLMEEGGEIKGKDPSKRWIIDPLDGTSNFIHAIPHWCITIALEENGEITHGLTFDPIRDELFTAEKGNGAFHRHQRLRVSKRKDPAVCMVAAGHYLKNKKHPEYEDAFRKLENTFPRKRNLGSMALEMAYLAAGRYDGFFALGHNAWDCAAGSLIIREAGGFVTTFDNKAKVTETDHILCGNPEIHALLLKTIK